MSFAILKQELLLEITIIKCVKNGKKETQVAKLTKLGNSKGIFLDNKIVEVLNLKVGDFLRLDIEKIEKED